jgi:hypothetical protein
MLLVVLSGDCQKDTGRNPLHKAVCVDRGKRPRACLVILAIITRLFKPLCQCRKFGHSSCGILCGSHLQMCIRFIGYFSDGREPRVLPVGVCSKYGSTCAGPALLS